MLGKRKHLALVFALMMSGVAAACGGGTTPNPDTANDKKDEVKTADTGTATTTPPPGDSAKPADTAKPEDKPAGKPEDKPAAAGPNKSTPIQASKMLEDVKKSGLDLAKLPKLGKMPLAQKKKIMPLFQKSLGYADCKGCHVENDYKAETRNLKIARGMWDNYVSALRDEKGGALFCDSCHNGTAKNLDRSDKKALGKFMEDEYEHKLTRADKKDHECSTCHGDAMEMKIIEKLWGIAAK